MLKQKINNSRLASAISFILSNDMIGNVQIFSDRNIAGDHMENIYADNGVYIDICREYGYIEVFGLNDKEYKTLCKMINCISQEDEVI